MTPEDVLFWVAVTAPVDDSGGAGVAATDNGGIWVALALVAVVTGGICWNLIRGPK